MEVWEIISSLAASYQDKLSLLPCSFLHRLFLLGVVEGWLVLLSQRGVDGVGLELAGQFLVYSRFRGLTQWGNVEWGSLRFLVVDGWSSLPGERKIPCHRTTFSLKLRFFFQKERPDRGFCAKTQPCLILWCTKMSSLLY